MKITLLFLLVSVSLTSNAQKSYEQLGEAIFSSFKSNNLNRLDSLVINGTDMIEISKLYKVELNSNETKNMIKKQPYHIQKFKTKCQRFREDTTYFKVNWNNATYTKTEKIERIVTNALDSIPDKNKDVVFNSMEIYFESGKDKFIIRFKYIYHTSDRWKIGDNVAFKKLE